MVLCEVCCVKSITSRGHLQQYVLLHDIGYFKCIGEVYNKNWTDNQLPVEMMIVFFLAYSVEL